MYGAIKPLRVNAARCTVVCQVRPSRKCISTRQYAHPRPHSGPAQDHPKQSKADRVASHV